MAHLHPDPDKVAFLTNTDIDGPVDMLNMLRFHEHAIYSEESNEGPCSGREAYGRYSKGVLPLIQALGGEMMGRWQPQLMFIGPKDISWDETFVVRYPAKQAFIDMISSGEYRAIMHHRTAALADSRLIVLKPVGN